MTYVIIEVYEPDGSLCEYRYVETPHILHGQNLVTRDNKTAKVVASAISQEMAEQICSHFYYTYVLREVKETD